MIKMLQLALMVEVDHKQLYPSITEYNECTYIQYDVWNKHLKLKVSNDDLCNPVTYQLIRNKVRYWVEAL